MPRHKTTLADPATGTYVLARYRRLMRLLLMAMLGTVIAAATLIFKHSATGPARITIALAIGIAFAMLLASALLGWALFAKRSDGRGADPAKPPTSADDPAE